MYTTLRYRVQHRRPRLRDQVCSPTRFSVCDAVLTLWPMRKRNFTYDDVHVKGAERIAKVSASIGVPRLVHVSHLNASPTSASQFYRSKAAGESAVREAFPAATIVRPGPMFGHEDKFLTNMSSTSFPHAFPALSLSPFLTRCTTLSLAGVVEAQPRPDQDPPRPRAPSTLGLPVVQLTFASFLPSRR